MSKICVPDFLNHFLIKYESHSPQQYVGQTLDRYFPPSLLIKSPSIKYTLFTHLRGKHYFIWDLCNDCIKIMTNESPNSSLSFAPSCLRWVHIELVHSGKATSNLNLILIKTFLSIQFNFDGRLTFNKALIPSVWYSLT